MMIGDRLRAIRASKRLSQGDTENLSGLLRCYVSRVENGHTVPAIDTLEKWARALNIPMLQLFYEGEAPPKTPDEIRHLEMSSRRRGPRGLGSPLSLRDAGISCETRSKRPGFSSSSDKDNSYDQKVGKSLREIVRIRQA